MAQVTDTVEKNKTFTLRGTIFSKTGNEFQGWGLNNTTKTYNGGQVIEGGFDSNKKLYAIWNPYQYTVHFNANGGTGSMSDQTFTYGVAQALNANAFTRTDYSFIGWATSATATTAAYRDKQSVSNLTAARNGTVQLYAVWSSVPMITITYDSNGGV